MKLTRVNLSFLIVLLDISYYCFNKYNKHIKGY